MQFFRETWRGLRPAGYQRDHRRRRGALSRWPAYRRVAGQSSALIL